MAASTEDEDLEQLLDSALDDFHEAEVRGNTSDSSQQAGAKAAWPSGDAVAASKLPTIQGLGGTGLPSRQPRKKKKEEAARNATQANERLSDRGAQGSSASSSSSGRPGSSSSPIGLAGSTVELLAERTRQTMQGMKPSESSSHGGAFREDELVDSLAKQLEGMGGSEDMQSLMDVMMRQLLSKEVLQDPMKEIGARYPAWLEANKASLSEKDRGRYEQQMLLIQQLCDVYESEPENYDRIVGLMQKMQECGQPPPEIVQELAPGLELGEDGLPVLPSSLGGGEGENGLPNCPVM